MISLIHQKEFDIMAIFDPDRKSTKKKKAIDGKKVCGVLLGPILVR
jgi:hypothetical protein